MKKRFTKNKMVDGTDILDNGRPITIDGIINKLNRLDELEHCNVHVVNCFKPTSFNKNKLPDDVKYAFNEGVELYQAIMSYEGGIIDEAEFIDDIRKVKKAYCLELNSIWKGGF